MGTARGSQWHPWQWHSGWRWPPALLPGAASAPVCSSLVRLVLLWARPNPALGARCCTATAHPAISTGGAARPGLIPTTSRLPARGPEINLSPGQGRRLCSVCPGISEEPGKEWGKARRRPGAFPSASDSPRSFPSRPFTRCVPAGGHLRQPRGEGSKTFAGP